jgi:hypothetical protein
MFSRKACYFFVRPRRDYLELCVFLGRTIRAPQIRKAMPSSKTKMAHIIRIRHRDEVEAPITEWLREAYGLQDVADAAPRQVKVTTREIRPALEPTSRSKPGRQVSRRRK